MIGGVLGWIIAVVTSSDPVTWPVLSALAGFFAAVLVLRGRFPAPAGDDRVRVSSSAGA